MWLFNHVGKWNLIDNRATGRLYRGFSRSRFQHHPKHYIWYIKRHYIGSKPALYICSPLQWRHNGHDGVSNHRRLDCLLNRLFRRRSKKTSKLRVSILLSFASVRGIHRWPVNSLHKGPVTRKMFPFVDVLMSTPCKQVIAVPRDCCSLIPVLMVFKKNDSYITVSLHERQGTANHRHIACLFNGLSRLTLKKTSFHVFDITWPKKL